VPTQAARTEATRKSLVSAARRLFAQKGFAATSTEEILAAAGVSRGAMYHQFSDKKALFRAAFEAVEDDLTTQVISAAAQSTDPVGQLQRGFDSFMDQCRNPEVQRIVMLDGPTVLGWDTWHEIDERYAFGSIKAVLTSAAEQGVIDHATVEPLSHLILGAVMQAGMVVARADDPVAARRAMSVTFARILSTLGPSRTEPSPSAEFGDPVR
jgi:AcrR family transcriptional regulator